MVVFINGNFKLWATIYINYAIVVMVYAGTYSALHWIFAVRGSYCHAIFFIVSFFDVCITDKGNVGTEFGEEKTL